MKVIEGWKKKLGEDWERTYGVSNSLYVARQNNILFSVLVQFMGTETMGDRLLLIETPEFETTPDKMLDVLTRIVADRGLGMVFFKDYFLMDVELLGGGGRAAIEREMTTRAEAPVAHSGAVPLQRLAVENGPDERNVAPRSWKTSPRRVICRHCPVSHKQPAARDRRNSMTHSPGESTMGTINGLEIHHEVQGTGPPIVFVHGLGATSNIWHAQRMALSKYFQIIVYDRRVQDAPSRTDGYSINTSAEELAGLLDHLAVPKAVVVGHSLGTLGCSTVRRQVRQSYAGPHPRRRGGRAWARRKESFDRTGAND